MEKLIMDFVDYAKKLNLTPNELLRFMVKQNKDVDYQNVGSNGFKNKSQVDDWWKKQSEATIIKVYDEYYGLEELLENEKI